MYFLKNGNLLSEIEILGIKFPVMIGAYDIIKSYLGMIGFDGGGWSRMASREVPISKNQYKTLSANNRTSYVAMPLAA